MYIIKFFFMKMRKETFCGIENCNKLVSLELIVLLNHEGLSQTEKQNKLKMILQFEESCDSLITLE